MTLCGDSTRGISIQMEWRLSRMRRPSSPCASSSRTRAGLGCRFFCVPENGWPNNARRLSSRFGAHGMRSSIRSDLIEAYERLIHDALIGDRTLFTRGDGIRRAWEVVADVTASPPQLNHYEPGRGGPRKPTN